jgi:DNA adenine methylase
MDSMASPLRYPGGKTRAVKLLWVFLKKEYPDITEIASPFFGGGSFELKCASNGITVYGNDLFEPVSTFWQVLKTQTITLVQMIEMFRPLSKAEFYRQRQYITTEKDPVLRAAYFFAINRCSFSGSTYSGGFSQQAADGRFTESCVERVRMTNMQNIDSVTNLDFEVFIKEHPTKVLFLDPPYLIKNYLYGRDGDLHHDFDHKRLATLLKTRTKWMLCYNDCPEIREMYSGCRFQSVNWSYGMNTSKKSCEVLIFPAKEGI